MCGRVFLVLASALTALAVAESAAAVTNVQIPGLQVALRAHGVYAGPIDGVSGSRTARAIRAFQREAGLTVDGIAGLQTRRALGKLGTPLFGRRLIRRGLVGWDVSVLQFLLMKRGLLDCAIDGRFALETEDALRRFQRRLGLEADGIAGRATFAALDSSGVRPPLTPKRYVRYVVRPGDSLTAIANRYETTVAALAKTNRLDPSDVLLIGVKLRIPAPTTPSPLAIRRRIDFWADRYALDRQLVRAVAWMESGYQPHFVSTTGDVGVMQVSDATWDFVETVLVGRRLPRTVDNGIRVGTVFLHHVLDVFDGDVRLAVAAYHQGPASVQERGLTPITKRYVANVLALRTRV